MIDGFRDRLSAWTSSLLEYPIFDWFRSHPTVSAWLFGVSLVTFFAGLLVTPVLIARLPANFFVRPRGPARWADRHPVIRFTLRTIKNLAGLVLILAGIAMLVLPGQGFVTIVIGICLLEFPGKRRFALRIMRQRPVRHGINWVRSKARRPPLIIPDRPARPRRRPSSEDRLHS